MYYYDDDDDDSTSAVEDLVWTPARPFIFWLKEYVSDFVLRGGVERKSLWLRRIKIFKTFQVLKKEARLMAK